MNILFDLLAKIGLFLLGVAVVIAIFVAILAVVAASSGRANLDNQYPYPQFTAWKKRKISSGSDTTFFLDSDGRVRYRQYPNVIVDPSGRQKSYIFNRRRS
ncbi:MAG: hypothetical protein HY567_02955 [Candidatus Kerfeldbacteria bacterium]|nr:hypothetical protein [Candidatus Kerfeldbacteria bacterium]